MKCFHITTYIKSQLTHKPLLKPLRPKLSVAAPDGTFRYRVVGSLISEFFGVGNPAGMTPEDVFGANAEVALSPLRICRDGRVPYMHTASASWLYRDRTYVFYTVLLLPFGESDDVVDKVLCCAEFLAEEAACA